MAPRNRRTDGDRYREADPNSSNSHQPFQNFHAGYLKIDEDHLYKTGIRGAKKYVLYCFVGFLIILTFANLIATVSIIGALRISHKGLGAFEFVPPGKLWRVFYDVDSYSLLFSDKGKIGGHSNRNLTFDAYDSSIHFTGNSKSNKNTSVSVAVNGTSVIADRFDVYDKATGKVMFTSNTHDVIGQRHHILFVDKLNAHKISSLPGEGLKVESDRSIYMTGMEGVNVDSRRVQMTAAEGISITSNGGSISASANEGVFLSNKMSTHPPNSQAETFKVCVCSTSGKLVLASPDTGCFLSGDENPCLS